MENTEHFEPRGRIARQRARTAARPEIGSVGWIVLWIAASVLPILPYAQPLWNNALAILRMLISYGSLPSRFSGRGGRWPALISTRTTPS